MRTCQDIYQKAIRPVIWSQVASDMLCCAAYMCSSAGYKMSRQPTLGKFSFTNSIDHRGSQRNIKLPDSAAKTQKCKMYYFIRIYTVFISKTFGIL